MYIMCVYIKKDHTNKNAIQFRLGSNRVCPLFVRDFSSNR